MWLQGAEQVCGADVCVCSVRGRRRRKAQEHGPGAEVQPVLVHVLDGGDDLRLFYCDGAHEGDVQSKRRNERVARGRSAHPEAQIGDEQRPGKRSTGRQRWTASAEVKEVEEEDVAALGVVVLLPILACRGRRRAPPPLLTRRGRLHDRLLGGAPPAGFSCGSGRKKRRRKREVAAARRKGGRWLGLVAGGALVVAL